MGLSYSWCASWKAGTLAFIQKGGVDYICGSGVCLDAVSVVR